jgi:hypothetical protein
MDGRIPGHGWPARTQTSSRPYRAAASHVGALEMRAAVLRDRSTWIRGGHLNHQVGSRRHGFRQDRKVSIGNTEKTAKCPG